MLNYVGNSLQIRGAERYVLQDGRDITRQKGLLKFLEPGESGVTKVKFSFTNDQTAFENNF